MIEVADWLVRSRRTDVAATLGLESVHTDLRLFGTPFAQDDIRVAYLRTQARRAWRGDDNLLPGEVRLMLEGRQGLDGLGALGSDALLLSRPGANPQAAVLRLDGSLTLFASPSLSARVALHVQETRSRLVSYETFGLGDATVGRGYDPSVLSGDRGEAVSAELRRKFSLSLPGVSDLSLLGFYDAGRTATIGAPNSARTLSSGGIGAEFTLARRLLVSATFAHPLEHPAPGAPMPKDRLILSATFLQF
jgi:hemolysin activation/secretion protein